MLINICAVGPLKIGETQVWWEVIFFPLETYLVSDTNSNQNEILCFSLKLNPFLVFCKTELTKWCVPLESFHILRLLVNTLSWGISKKETYDYIIKFLRWILKVLILCQVFQQMNRSIIQNYYNHLK